MRKHIKKLNYIFIILIPVIILSCSSSKERTPIYFTVIANGSNSGYTKKDRIAIRNKQDFQEMWNNLYINYSEKPPLPDVDFNKSIVIGVFFGEYTNGGGAISVKSVEEYDTMIMVKVEEITPGHNCVTTDVMTQPYQIIQIPKVSLPINYTTANTVRNCN